MRSSADALLFLANAAPRHTETDPSLRRSSNSITVDSDSLDRTGRLVQTPSWHMLVEEPQTHLGHSNLDSLNKRPESPWGDKELLKRVSSFRCNLFRENIVLPYEALEFLSFFFKNLYSFFPFIPDFYYECINDCSPNPDVFRSVFEDDEVLLGALITVSSRYYRLPGMIGGYERSGEIHNRCWEWTKAQISRVIFEGTRPKSLLSVIEALLVLAEWLPRSIHAFVEQSDLPRGSRGGHRSQYDSLNETILQPAFRTDHVAWSVDINEDCLTLFTDQLAGLT